MIARGRIFSALLAGACGVAGVALGGLHPIAPGGAMAAVALVAAFVAWRPDAWLWLVPALAPLANFAPWTGGLAIEEFDLLVLAAAAGWHGRAAWDGAVAPAPRRPDRAFRLAAIAFALLTAVSLARGVSAAGLASDTPAWFQGYDDPMNAWRVAKSVLWAALFWRPLHAAFGAHRDAAIRRLAGGMLAGLLVVSLAAAWERAAYPGLWDFSGHYRTTALFWEMHVGGGAIDAYLAVAAPFVAWALWSQKTPWLWAAGAVLALVGGYAALTTFSRGVYLAVGVPLLMLGLLRAWRRARGERARFVGAGLAIAGALAAAGAVLAAVFVMVGTMAAAVALVAIVAVATWAVRRRRPTGWRALASFALALLLVLEVAAVVGLGSFLRERLGASSGDYVSRRLHWGQGLGLLHGPADWAFGLGAGRLPHGYGTQVKGVAYPGTIAWHRAHDGAGTVRLSGAAGPTSENGLLMLEQRVALHPGRGPRVALDVRVATPTRLLLRLCETHLLYANQCQGVVLFLLPGGGAAQHLELALPGAPLSAGVALWPRRAAFGMAVMNAGGRVDLASARLWAPDGTPLLTNERFERGLAHWLPVAMDDFAPWHIDNLYLDVLVERGLPAMLAFVAGVALVLRRLLGRATATIAFAPYLAATLVGALCAGLVDSVIDVPRVAFLLFLLLIAGEALAAGADEVSAPASPSTPAA